MMSYCETDKTEREKRNNCTEYLKIHKCRTTVWFRLSNAYIYMKALNSGSVKGKKGLWAKGGRAVMLQAIRSSGKCNRVAECWADGVKLHQWHACMCVCL